MQAVMFRPKTGRSGIVQLPVDDIDPNPNQPRRAFGDEALAELAASVAQYGVITPLSVRLHYGRYELVAGERRLRAARLAGLRSVPCVILDVDLEESSLIALVENMQRQDLDFIEEARGIANLTRLFGLSQDEAAKKLGKSQSAVANKLRLLRLPDDVLDSLRENALTERHGRALLRLAGADEQRSALAEIIGRGMNVAHTDAYIDRLLAAGEEKDKSAGKKSFILKDVRVFLNSLSHSVDIMKRGGIDAGVKTQETDSELIVTISIPKKS